VVNVIYADSSLKEACVVILDTPSEDETILYAYLDAPVTNNTGEYRAVGRALDIAWQYGFTDVLILTDSQLVVEQVNGRWKCKYSHLYELRDKIQRKMKQFEHCELRWVSREDNLAGKVLEKR